MFFCDHAYQISCLKRELRKAETLLSIRFKERPDTPAEGVPIEFVRNTILKFLETDPPGTDEHECLIPVISSIFAFTGDEIRRLQHRRYETQHETSGSRWLHLFAPRSGRPEAGGGGH